LNQEIAMTDILKRLLIPALGVAVLLGLIGRSLWTATARAQSTTPAVAASPAPARVAADGRLVARPGAEVTLGSDLDGTVARVAVDEKDHVRRGQVLIELRADDIRASLAEAKARIAEADADIRLAATEVERARRLLAAAVGTPREVDRAERDLDAARARRETAVASVARNEAVLAKTRVVSPIDGVVLSRDVQPGETIEKGRPLMRVADLSRTRVEAEVDEFDAAAIAPGAPVTVSAEGYADRWPARVEEIPDAVSGRRLKPDDPGRPTDTRVLLVKIAFDQPTPLKLGQRVEVEIGAAGTRTERR
jgi:RND family efflux transporter MFP subunit